MNCMFELSQSSWLSFVDIVPDAVGCERSSTIPCDSFAVRMISEGASRTSRVTKFGAMRSPRRANDCLGTSSGIEGLPDDEEDPRYRKVDRVGVEAIRVGVDTQKLLLSEDEVAKELKLLRSNVDRRSLLLKEFVGVAIFTQAALPDKPRDAAESRSSMVR